MRKRRKDITGQKFHWLTAVEPDDRLKCGWLCRCDCGKEFPVQMGNLKSGNTKSCYECGRKRTASSSRSHGMTETKFYGVWQAMLNRCRNKNLKGSHRYFGRIKVCERWLKFENFKEDMFPLYEEGLSIERNDNDGDYCPENCTWETPITQANNRSTSRLIEIHGTTRTLAEWCRILGKKYSRVMDRLCRGKSIEEAMI